MTEQKTQLYETDVLTTVPVELGSKSYDILIGFNLLEKAGDIIRTRFKSRKCIIISDENVAKHYLATLEVSLEGAGYTCENIVVAPGEGSKSFHTLEHVCTTALSIGIERSDLIIALGGGVIGDLAGFAAAIINRGLKVVQIPTSLLAQVDSSVGGKTGINTAQGKNLIGAFHQPSLVLTDLNVLDTLPLRQLQAGYAEIAKYGLLGDASFFSWLEENSERVINGDAQARAYAIEKSCLIKAAIVAEDELEKGKRALLNLGHTFGHALEAATGYGDKLLHGEAVSVGMGLAFDLSERLEICAKGKSAEVKNHLKKTGLPINLADIDNPISDADMFISLMMKDKKVSDGKLTFILARDIGDAFTKNDVSHTDLVDFLEHTIRTQ